MKPFKQVLSLTIALAATLVLPGCGANMPVSNGLVGGNSQPFGTQTSGSVNQSALAQQCQAAPNVTGSQYSNTIGQNFRVCSATQLGGAVGTIAVFPADGAQKQVCIFAARAYFGGSTPTPIVSNAYADPSQRYVAQCVNIAAGGSAVNFGTLQFNSAYIVPPASAATFANCIAMGNIDGCAAGSGIQYSVGSW
jgi:hypothetical protein